VKNVHKMDSSAKNLEEMEIFIRNVEPDIATSNLSQNKMFATTQLVEFCMDHRNARNSEVVI